MAMEGARTTSIQFIRGEKGDLLRDPILKSAKWSRYFDTLLDTVSEKNDSDIIVYLSAWPAAKALGVEQTETKVSDAFKSMTNAKAVGSDDLPAELPKLRPRRDGVITPELHQASLLLFVVWRTGKVPQLWKNATVKVLHKKKDRQSAAATVASRSWSMRTRCSLSHCQETLRLLQKTDSLVPDEQYGFHPSRSTTNMMLVRAASAAGGTGAERRGALVRVFHRPFKRRTTRSTAPLSGRYYCASRCATTGGRFHSKILRGKESVCAVSQWRMLGVGRGVQSPKMRPLTADVNVN